MKKKEILLTDDEQIILKTLSRDLEKENYNVTTAENGIQAIAKIKDHRYDMVITDLVMEGLDGIQVLKAAKKMNPDIPVIILTGYGAMSTAIDALRLGADDYLLKPCEIDELLFRISRCLERTHLKENIKTYANDLKKTNKELKSKIRERNQAINEVRELNDELEQRVVDRTIELETANKELRDIAYITAHDLKAPLRAIGNLGDILLEDHAETLNKDGKELINLIIGRVKRMDNHINGILKYSSIGQTEREKVKVDLDSLVERIIDDTISPPKNIHITVKDKLPVIVYEKTWIHEVFLNLLDNAVKFMDKPQGQIKIECSDQGTHYRFGITDNGPGIEDRFHARIFQMFQVLTARDIFESTGIGLSVVRKIIELSNGKIWVESKKGKGSSFFFTVLK